MRHKDGQRHTVIHFYLYRYTHRNDVKWTFIPGNLKITKYNAVFRDVLKI